MPQLATQGQIEILPVLAFRYLAHRNMIAKQSYYLLFS